MGDAYNATIERIKSQGGDKSRLGMAALMWISHAERPLSADGLCHALVVELGSTDFNVDNAPTIATLVTCCEGLITVDKEGSTVRLIHFTLQEYLSIRQDIFGRPHSTIAETCLTIMNSQQVKAISADPYPIAKVTDFLEYCSLNWGAQAKRDLSDSARPLALVLLRECDNHISLKLLMMEYVSADFKAFDSDFAFSGLDCASFFGIGDLVAALIKMECYDINKGGLWGNTPLKWAAWNGHEEVVKILLNYEAVDPDKPDELGFTPLSSAAVNGHEGVVNVLLRQEKVNPNKPDNSGRTPLSYAAETRHEGVVKILLGREVVNPHVADHGGRTPVAYAAQRGNKEMIKILFA